MNSMPLDDYGVENQAIERRRQMAQALMQNTQQAPQGRMVGRVFVAPNPLEYLAQGVRNFGAGQQLEQADADQKALGERVRTQNTADVQKYVDALRGTSAQPAMQGNNPSAYVPEQAAAPGDPNKALAVALNSRNPMLQTAGAAQLKEMTAGPKWEKVEFPNPDGSRRVGYVNVNSRDPISTFQAGGTAPVKLEGVNTGGNTTFVNPYAPTASGAPTVAATGNPYKDKLVAGPNGPVVNAPLVNAEKEIKAAGRPVTNVNVSTANKPFLTQIGKGVGEQVVNDFAGARSAVQTLNNVQQIRQGLGNAILGPGANVRVTLSQLGQVLGINGKDATEQLQNTRAIMQGLARQELAAAGQMKGQGQITESERSILRNAEAGQVDELTGPEVQTLLGALEKTSKYRIGLHNQNLERLKKDPNAAGVADYMQVTPPETGGFRIVGTE